MDGCVRWWVGGWMDGWIGEWVGGRMDGWMGEWIGGWMDGWVIECMNKRVIKIVSHLSSSFSLCVFSTFISTGFHFKRLHKLSNLPDKFIAW